MKARHFRILSIDGGGIRGIIPAQILVELERKLQAEGDPEARIADYFDLIAGTSTGGILTCIYLAPDRTDAPREARRPRFTAQQAVDLYLEHGDEIFDVPFRRKVLSLGGLRDEKYPSKGLENALESYLGDLELRDLLGPCLITAYDVRRRETRFFTSHDAHEPRRNFLVRDVARATSAAPTFFEAASVRSSAGFEHPLIDGGVFANNPAMCAYAEARTMPDHPTAVQMVIVSLGTGENKRRYYHDDVKDWGPLGWAKPLLEIMMSAVSETIDYQLGQMFDAVGAKAQYVRIQTPLPERNVEMDNAEPGNLEELQEIGATIAERRGAELDAVVKLLKAKPEGG